MKKYINIFMLCAAMLGCAARPARAQYLGTTSPQSVNATIAPAGTACTGVGQNYSTANTTLNALGFRNIGQTIHQVTFIPSGSIISAQVLIFGVDNAGNFTQISDSGYFVQFSASNVLLTAIGNYTNIVVQVTCSPNATGTYTLSYSGSSSTGYVNAGQQLSTQLVKLMTFGAAANANFLTGFFSPLGSSSGTIEFQYVLAGPSGSTITVSCPGTLSPTPLAVFNLSTTASLQTFTVPPFPCVQMALQYTSGGASATTISLTYFFSPQGLSNTTLANYVHITGTTATVVKATAPATLVSLTVNTPVAGTISVFDLAGAACTGTPATNTVAVITATATAPIATLPYNVAMNNGICVKTSIAMDLTVSAQ